MYPNLWKYLQKQEAYYDTKPFATYEKQQLTFGTLTRQVKQLSVFLNKATNQTVVGIKLTDPLESIVAILATLVSSKAFWVTSDQILEKVQPDVLKQVFIIDGAFYAAGLSYKTDAFKFEDEIMDQAPFCWATSSGSLATPKITEHSYYSLMEDTFRQIKTHNIKPQDKIDVISSLSFSASLSSIFPALFAGASLHFYNTSSLSVTAIYEFWQTESITMTTLIPTVFRSLLRFKYDFEKLNLRFICLGGEPVLISDISLFQEQFPAHCILQVSVASSEARGIAEYITNTHSPLPENEISYCAVDQKKLSIVNKDGNPVPPCQNGQIRIASGVIGSRYVQGPDSFTQLPNGEYAFTSDDIGNIGHDGKLRVDSRLNNVVKCKGEFVDLNQIKNDILQHDQILDCYVDVDKNNTVLCVVIYGLLNKPSARKMVNEVLKTSSFQLFLFTKEFPRTHSGKPDIRLIKAQLRADHSLEYSDEDLLYYEQWKSIFPGETHFEGKHFFTDLGGDSISVMDLTIKLNKVFGISFEPSTVFSYPYYEELFHYLKNAHPYTLKALDSPDREKKNILIFPALTGNYNNYLPVVDSLKARYNFYLIQYPTRADKRYQSPDHIAKECAVILHESNLQFECMIGTCFSGYLAYCTAHHYDQNSGVILLDTHTYRKYGSSRKILSDVLRACQVIYQHTKEPSYLLFLLKRRLIRYNKNKATKVARPGSPMRSQYNSFFKEFSKTSHKLPQTHFPLGLFLADTSDNIRHRIEYDFDWRQYNPNVRFTKRLKGDHTHFSVIQENIRCISNEIDQFVQKECIDKSLPQKP